MKRRSAALFLLAGVTLGAAAIGRQAPSRRGDVLRQALAHWTFGGADLGAGRFPLRTVGGVEVGRADSRVARLQNGYFDAGADLHAPADQITVYLRARDPRGLWSYGLFSKRGGPDRVHFNLYSVDLPGTPGPDIGFEVSTEVGFAAVAFPVSKLDPAAWHDFVGRCDGKTLSLYCDGRLMARRRWQGRLTRNQEPVLIGAETDNGRVVRPFTGEMEEAALWPRALSDTELAALMRTPKLTADPDVPPLLPAPDHRSPVHFRPKVGRLADTIPFFWRGEYHVFYLRAVAKVPWEHIVSRDLTRWRELPAALRPDGLPDSADGLHMFTGCVVEREGLFHIFYTGWNPANPQGREFILHADSPDLVTWTKRPGDVIAPDGKLYSAARERDFRDPYVFWNPGENRYWMLFCSGAQTGLATSPDLKAWTLQPPIASDYAGMGTPECPDYFEINGTHHLIVSPTALNSTIARYADSPAGPYRDPKSRAIDTPILYAAKRMFDGRRHVLTGWLRDLGGERDGGSFEWGGTQSVPREVWAGPGGQLHFRPVPEARAAFSRTVWDLKAARGLQTASRWSLKDGALVGEGDGPGSQCLLDAPDNYLLETETELDPGATLTLTFREQGDGAGYRLALRPTRGEAEISGPGFAYPRPCDFGAGKRVRVTAFVQGTTIECFVNDAYAFSCRAYNFGKGRLGLSVEGGKARVFSLTLKGPGRR